MTDSSDDPPGPGDGPEAPDTGQGAPGDGIEASADDPGVHGDGPGAPGDDLRAPTEDVDDTPTITCERCGRAWDLAYELDDMGVGNQAVEQFALDHHRHTGHFPDDVATWRATCRRCTEEVERLARDAARRWAETHARHTNHAIDLHHADGETTTRVEAPD